MTAAFGAHIPSWTVGDRCRKAREDSGHGSAEFADLIGVSRNTVGNVEAGRVRPRKIVLIAWAMATGVPIDWLRDGTVPTNTNPDGGNIDDGPLAQSVELRTFNPKVRTIRRVTQSELTPLKVAI